MDEKVRALLQENNGVLKLSDAKAAGIPAKTLQRLAVSGELERISHGLYLDKDCVEDEYFTAQYKCEKGIFSHETALYFHELSDRTPLQLMMTIPSGHNSRLLKEKGKYKFFYCKPELWEVGIMTALSPQGHALRLYNKERTLCDCIKKRNALEDDLVLSAVKQYMKEKGNDYARLLAYAELFGMKEKVKQYMEVLG